MTTNDTTQLGIAGNGEVAEVAQVGVGSTHLLGVVRSVYDNQDDILRGIQQLHCPEGFECDMTYGNGAFWKNLPRPKYCFG